MALPEYLKRKIAEFGMPPDVEHDPTQLAQMQAPALTATAPSSEVQPVKIPLSQALDPAYEPSMQPKQIPLQANPALNAATTGNMARLPGPISTPSRLDQLQAKYDTLNQSPTLKGTLLRSLAVALPTLAGAEFGGIYGASGAAQGAASGLEEATQQRNLQKQAAYKSLEDELQRQERMGERQLTTTEKGREADLRDKTLQEQIAEREQAAQEAVAGRANTAQIAAGTRQSVADTNKTARLAAVAGKVQTVIGPDGKPHLMQMNPETGDYDKDVGVSYEKPTQPNLEMSIAADWLAKNPGKSLADFNEYNKKIVPSTTFNLNQPNRNDAQWERSYNARSKDLETVGKPVADALSKVNDMKTLLDAGTPQADALVAPKLLTVMVGGQGTGLRMTQAEIEQTLGGRSKWESLKSDINKWSLDPKTANSILPEQRDQIRKLVDAVEKKAAAKTQVLDEARSNLVDEQDQTKHGRIVADTRKKLEAIDMGQQGGGSDFPIKAPNGKTYHFKSQQDADNFKKSAGIP